MNCLEAAWELFLELERCADGDMAARFGRPDIYVADLERNGMTHAELVQIGARYMRKTLRCSPVLTERKCAFAREVPDVIGWRCGGFKPHPLHDTLDSFVIEVKVNRGDFLRDMKKPHRNGPAYGRYRFYLTPKGLIGPDELPERWGLLEFDERKVRRVHNADFFEGMDVMRREFGLLRSLGQEFERYRECRQKMPALRGGGN